MISVTSCDMQYQIGQLSTIPPKKRTPEAIQAYIRHKRDLPHEAFKGGFILEKIANPISTGQLSLINTNVDDNPSVTFNYFSHPYDLQRCVDGIRVATKVVQSKHFTDYTKCDKQTVEKLLNLTVKANVNLIPKHTNDTKSLEQFCRDTVITIWHYHGGAHVGKVVGPDYKVLGVNRLRVVDGSTFTESPGTNPQATVMMMGRYIYYLTKMLKRVKDKRWSCVFYNMNFSAEQVHGSEDLERETGKSSWNIRKSGSFCRTYNQGVLVDFVEM